MQSIINLSHNKRQAVQSLRAGDTRAEAAWPATRRLYLEPLRNWSPAPHPAGHSSSTPQEPHLQAKYFFTK